MTPSHTLNPEKGYPFAALDGSTTTQSGSLIVDSLKDADEALSFLRNHPHSAQIGEEGLAILEDPIRLNKLVRKIDLTIAPLLAAVYFLQFLDKTTLSYTAVMGIRTDTHLKGQDYSNLSMLFYIGVSPHVYRQCISNPKRLPCSRISHTILGATYLKTRIISRY